MARNYVRETQEVRNLNKEIIKGEDFIKKQEGAAKKLLATIAGVNDELSKSGNFSEKNLKQSKLISQAGQASLKFTQSKTKEDKKALDEIKKQYNTYRDLGGEQIKSIESILKQSEQIEVQDSLLEKIKSNQDKIAEALADQIPFGKQIKDLFSKSAKGTAKIAAGLAIGFGILKQFTDRTKVIGDEFGAIGMNNEQFKQGILDASANAVRLGFDVKDVADVTKELTTNFGLSRDEALGLSVNIIDTSRALGLSNSEGTKLIGSLTQIAGLSFQSANDFAKQTSLLAQANGAAPNAVIRDIAESSETIAKFTGMTPDNLAKAAIQANKLGLSLKDIGQVAEGILDFEGSLNKELEASVILGRNINLQRARQLALNNDLQGVAVEITKQVGSEAEFNQLNLIERKALAESIGLSVEQLSKVVTNQNKVKTLNDAIAGTKPFEELLGRDSLDNITKLVNDFKAIGANLVNIFGPSVSFIAGGFAKITGFLAESKGFVNGLSAGLVTLAALSLKTAIPAIYRSFSFIPGGLGIPLAVAATAGLISQVASLQEGGITTQEGLVNVHPQEAIVPIEELGGMIADAMKPVVEETQNLRQDMNSYFGFGGSAVNGISKGVVTGIQNA